MKEQLMSIEELSKYLNVKPQAIYNWLREDRYGLRRIAKKAGKCWRFKKEDVAKWIERNGA